MCLCDQILMEWQISPFFFFFSSELTISQIGIHHASLSTPMVTIYQPAQRCECHWRWPVMWQDEYHPGLGCRLPPPPFGMRPCQVSWWPPEGDRDVVHKGHRSISCVIMKVQQRFSRAPRRAEFPTAIQKWAVARKTLLWCSCLSSSNFLKLKAQYVVSAARGISIKTIKTKDVVWWCHQLGKSYLCHVHSYSTTSFFTLRYII